MKMSISTNATPDPNRIDPGASVRAVLDRVVDRALTTRPRLAARHWYASLLEELGEGAQQAPSRHKFERMVSDERRRRRSVLEALTAAAADAVAAELRKAGNGASSESDPAIVGECLLVLRALALFRSAGPSNAYLDYTHPPRGQRRGELSEEAFRTFIFDPAVVAHVPEEIMPTWWRKRAVKLRISRSASAEAEAEREIRRLRRRRRPGFRDQARRSGR